MVGQSRQGPAHESWGVVFRGCRMARAAATRSEFLAQRAELDLARRGRDLLEDKRDELLDEFRKIADLVLAGEDEAERSAAAARHALAVAEAFDGPELVAAAAVGGRSSIPLSTRAVSIMGVRIVDIESGPLGRPRTGRGYTIEATTPRVDEAAARFEAELEVVLDLAARELRLRRLVDEIAKTTRRLNALDHVVVPELEAETRRIRAVLDERERQDRFRLARATSRKDRRR